MAVSKTIDITGLTPLTKAQIEALPVGSRVILLNNKLDVRVPIGTKGTVNSNVQPDNKGDWTNLAITWETRNAPNRISSKVLALIIAIDPNQSSSSAASLSASAPTLDTTKESTISTTEIVLASIGLLGGLYYAHKQKSGLGAYVGYAALGGVALGVAGKIGVAILSKSSSNSQLSAKAPSDSSITKVPSDNSSANAPTDSSSSAGDINAQLLQAIKDANVKIAAATGQPPKQQTDADITNGIAKMGLTDKEKQIFIDYMSGTAGAIVKATAKAKAGDTSANPLSAMADVQNNLISKYGQDAVTAFTAKMNSVPN